MGGGPELGGGESFGFQQRRKGACTNIGSQQVAQGRGKEDRGVQPKGTA